MGKYSPYDGSIEVLPKESLPEFDCHCHILPGLDDGSSSMEESPELCRWLVRRGYKRAFIATHGRLLSSP